MNPLRIEQTAATLDQALRMPPIEQAKRMRLLRANVTTFDAAWWATQMVEDARLAGVGAEEQWSTAVA